MAGMGSANDGYGFQVGSQNSTRTHTHENPTRIPAGYMIPVVQHYLALTDEEKKGLLGMQQTEMKNEEDF
jgi:hypothetical protein